MFFFSGSERQEERHGPTGERSESLEPVKGNGVLVLCLDDEREGLRVVFEDIERPIGDQLTRCPLRGGD